MGTHPIFESDFDCLTVMEKFISLQRQLLVKMNLFLENDETLVSMLGDSEQTQHLLSSIGLLDKENTSLSLVQRKLEAFENEQEMELKLSRFALILNETCLKSDTREFGEMIKCAVKTIVTHRPNYEVRSPKNPTPPRTTPSNVELEVDESYLVNINYLVTRPSQLKPLKEMSLPANLALNIADFMSLSDPDRNALSNDDDKETKSNIVKCSATGASLRLVDKHNEEQPLCALDDQGVLFSTVNHLSLP